MRSIDFNDLPRTTRERFVRSLLSDAPASRPICQRVSRQRSPLAWYLLLAVAIGSLAALAAFRFGAVEAAVQDRRLLGGYVAASAALGLALSMLARRRALRGSLPFAPGVYVFPLDLVDARTRQLELYSLSELMSLDPVHHSERGKYTHSSLWLIFPTKSFVFEARGRYAADTQLAAVQKARENLAAAIHRGALGELTSLDPFADARARNFEPASDHGLLARGRPVWTRSIWAITVIAGLTLGVGAWRVRNWQSDVWAFSRLRARPEVAPIEAYVAGGGLRAAEAQADLLPRARLADATRAPDGAARAAAIEHFLATHPGTSAEADARAALGEAIHAEFARESTVSGLRALVARWPNARDVPAANAKIRDLYRETRGDFQKRANVADKSVVPVVEALLAYAEEGAAPIDVRFRRRSAASLAAADGLLAKGLLDDDGPAAGGNAEVSGHLGGDDASRREKALVVGLQRTFRAIFPADVLALRLGEPIDAPAAIPGTKPLAEVAAPTIVIDYELGWAGTTYVARDSRRRYLGVFVRFDLTVQVPGEARVLAFATKVEPPESFPFEALPDDPVFETLLPPPSGAPDAGADGRVYAVMLLRAFDQMAVRMQPHFFDTRTAATPAPEDPSAAAP
ncbi:MAG: hypothetical protein KF795_18760 [Labilithrix sp.]|nr:hypothetical protein [Labilithrix sp.]